MEDCLVITVDINQNDKSALLVTRNLNNLSFKIVNQFWGDEAVELYNRLTERNDEKELKNGFKEVDEEKK